MWKPNEPISGLPDSIKKEFVEEARFLLKELKQRNLEVILIPAPKPRFEEHMIRAVTNTNPAWYRKLYKIHPSLERKNVVQALERISKSKDGMCYEHCYHAWFTYDTVFREMIKERLVEGHESDDHPYMPPNKRVRRYFKTIERRAKGKKKKASRKK